ncbi:MAG: methyltransferase domain-containing protein [Candidatus Omnitrophota bacterium]
MLENIGCNLCGADNYTVVYKTYTGDISTLKKNYTITDHTLAAPLRIVKCRHCNLIYANPRQPVDELKSTYKDMQDELYIQEEKGRRLSDQSILRILKKMGKTGKLLEIGCATGFLLDEARKTGWEIYGVELSSWAVHYAQTNLKIETIFEGSLHEKHYANNFFDVVIIKDTLEHIPDPKGLLIETRRILKTNGIICINTPDIASFLSRILKARWWGVKQHHIFYFTQKTLFAMLRAAGFMPIKSKSHTRIFSLQYWVSRFKSYNKVLHDIFIFLIQKKIIRNVLFPIDFKDQIEVYAKKIRKIEYLEELEIPPLHTERNNLKKIVVLPAYNAAKTLEKTVSDISRDIVDDILLVDDGSTDDTINVAKKLGLKVFEHDRNKGYGANQKTCYKKALELGADVVIMVHPDYQYDPKAIADLIEPIEQGRADAVFGSRMMKGGALEGGMPLWKHNINIILTALENIAFGVFLTEYHSGFRAYSAKTLRSIHYCLNSDNFVFDTEIIVQLFLHNLKIEEIPIRTRYFDEASTIKFLPAVFYGFGILMTIAKYILHTHTMIRFKQFE